MVMSTRKSFVAHFGSDQAAAIEDAADSHKNGIHDSKGSDPFRWAIVICIGHQCMEVDGYREHHGITAPWEEIEAWIKEHGDLANHDGDSDYLALFAGVYTKYMPSAEATP